MHHFEICFKTIAASKYTKALGFIFIPEVFPAFIYHSPPNKINHKFHLNIKYIIVTQCFMSSVVRSLLKYMYNFEICFKIIAASKYAKAFGFIFIPEVFRDI